MTVELRECLKRYSYPKKHQINELLRLGESIRARGYISRDELLKILEWKAERAKTKLEDNSEIIESVSQLAFRTSDVFYKISLLSVIRGVGVPVASAVLRFVYPEEFGIIDINAWTALAEMRRVKEKKFFASQVRAVDYVKYLEILRELAQEQGMSVSEVDMALYEYGKRLRAKRG